MSASCMFPDEPLSLRKMQPLFIVLLTNYRFVPCTRRAEPSGNVRECHLEYRAPVPLHML